eukprot:SAG11_NODE_5725_length_1479_cov_1.062319_1_plen_190_part_10
MCAETCAWLAPTAQPQVVACDESPDCDEDPLVEQFSSDCLGCLIMQAGGGDGPPPIGPCLEGGDQGGDDGDGDDGGDASPQCVDMEGWADAFGRGCDDYQSYDWCRCGANPSADSQPSLVFQHDSDGSPDSRADADGVDALQACCYCQIGPDDEPCPEILPCEAYSPDGTYDDCCSSSCCFETYSNNCAA